MWLENITLRYTDLSLQKFVETCFLVYYMVYFCKYMWKFVKTVYSVGYNFLCMSIWSRLLILFFKQDFKISSLIFISMFYQTLKEECWNLHNLWYWLFYLLSFTFCTAGHFTNAYKLKIVVFFFHDLNLFIIMKWLSLSLGMIFASSSILSDINTAIPPFSLLIFSC